jgi:hypothetical protein
MSFKRAAVKASAASGVSGVSCCTVVTDGSVSTLTNGSILCRSECMSYKTFMKFRAHLYPDIALTRAAEDMCDTCTRSVQQIVDPFMFLFDMMRLCIWCSL